MTARSFDGIDAIVVGASAGGVEALIQVLPALPVEARAAVLVVLHLPRNQPSSLVGIFAPKCALPVREAEDKMPVAAGTITFAPPDYHLLVDRDDDGSPALALSADDVVNYSRPSIDVLFESAADMYGERVAGMILTGANADGTTGLAAIRRAGGIAIVQEPSTAYARAMPSAAAAGGVVDFRLPLDGIAALLRGLPRAKR